MTTPPLRARKGPQYPAAGAAAAAATAAAQFQAADALATTDSAIPSPSLEGVLAVDEGDAREAQPPVLSLGSTPFEGPPVWLSASPEHVGAPLPPTPTRDFVRHDSSGSAGTAMRVDARTGSSLFHVHLSNGGEATAIYTGEVTAASAATAAAAFAGDPSQTTTTSSAIASGPAAAAAISGGGDGSAEPEVSPYVTAGAALIPSEIPPSPLLYVLTTSEGRDKLFKSLQYVLKCAIVLLNVKDLFPSGASEFIAYWSARFSSNVVTIRNGRALFKVGRWIVTLFHLVSIVDRLLTKVRCAAVGAGGRGVLHVAAKPAAGPRLLSYVPRNLSFRKVLALSLGSVPPEDTPQRQPLQRHRSMREVDSGYFSGDVEDDVEQHASAQREADDGTAQPPVEVLPLTPLPAPFAHPSQHRRALYDFSVPLMCLLALRTVASISRNIIRDTLFLTSKEFFGIGVTGPSVPAGATWLHRLLADRHGQRLLQGWANRFWFAVSVADLVINTSRLAHSSWIHAAMVDDSRLVCGCNWPARFGHGSTSSPPTPLSPTNRAGSPSSTALSPALPPPPIRNKRQLFFPPLDFDFGCPTTVTPKFFEAASPVDMMMACAKCGCCCQVLREGFDVRAGAIVKRDAAGDSFRAGRIRHTRGNVWHVMLLPWLIRKGYSLLWAVSSHENLKQTCMLQLKYICDVLLSYGYCFGDYEPPAEALEKDVGQHLHAVGSACGLVSAIIALWRVYLSGMS